MTKRYVVLRNNDVEGYEFSKSFPDFSEALAHAKEISPKRGGENFCKAQIWDLETDTEVDWQKL